MVLSAMVLLVLAGVVVGAQALSRTATVSNHLSDRISPARTAVVEFRAALADQETGVRGYLLSSQRQFLEPYTRGIGEARAAVSRMRALLSDEPGALAALTAAEQEAGRWRAVADRLIAGHPAGAGPASMAVVLRGQDAFTTVRSRVIALDERLAEIRRDGRADLDRSRRVRDGVFLFLAAVLLAFIVVIAVLLRLAVLRPLSRLSAAVRRVAGGDFEHRLTPHGPADLARLGHDVEAMRRRLVDGLAASQQARDQLEQQRRELERSNADLEQFAYVASHDLQEPLRKVASFCQLLQRRYAGALDERAQQYISFAVEGATRMQSLINDLLGFSRIGRVHNATQPVDLDLVVAQVEDGLALAIAESGARIVRPALPTVHGDATLLTMLWQNLIGNAIKFRRPQGEPVIHITAAQADGVWTFAVQDNGIGVDPEFAGKIFVIFQRLHPRDSYPGTGIGLAVCKKIVEYHGGHIALDPAYREGARLTFTLAAAVPAAVPAEDAPAPAG
ncbi:sensor histidine kinase [Amorphoplanes nipponensis]|uniref:histidine kinase n=1 Tax=Actinoplanes nipponensis TaxID=135950 RepID=A0A919JVQ5_9ACTN|nr:histidine kinase [Actinoplanes nipponensis]